MCSINQIIAWESCRIFDWTYTFISFPFTGVKWSVTSLRYIFQIDSFGALDRLGHIH